MKESSDELAVSGTAIGPADVRDTPHVKPGFPVEPEPAPPEDDPWVGRILSNVYVIEEKIGEGGMGSVYAARHVHLEKRFAVKVLVDTITARDNAVDRLKQEAMAAANIDHDNIVDVVNFDRTDDGAVFIVMELLKGESLSETLGRGPIDLHHALPITYQLCRALHAAHERGIVHRDLKPENIFLTERHGKAVAKVLDFGISKVKSAEAEQVRMTKTGQLVGTPLYMSPEQARGETEIDRRVDIYALGVMLYEMITGTPPFEGRNYFELLWKHGNEPPPSMRETNPNVYFPDALEEVVSVALAKQPGERFQTMAELEEALRAGAPDIGDEIGSLAKLAQSSRKRSPAHPPTAHSLLSPAEPRVSKSLGGTAEGLALIRRSPWPLVAIGAGLALALGALAYAALGPVETPPPVSVSGHRAPPEEPRLAPVMPSEPELVPEPPRGEEPPRRVSVHLTSSPSGARVRIGDRALGATPLATALEASPEPVTLTYEHEGYLTQTLTLVLVEGVQVPEVRLRRRRRARSSGPTGGGGLPIKTGM